MWYNLFTMFRIVQCRNGVSDSPHIHPLHTLSLSHTHTQSGVIECHCCWKASVWIWPALQGEPHMMHRGHQMPGLCAHAQKSWTLSFSTARLIKSAWCSTSFHILRSEAFGNGRKTIIVVSQCSLQNRRLKKNKKTLIFKGNGLLPYHTQFLRRTKY